MNSKKSICKLKSSLFVKVSLISKLSMHRVIIIKFTFSKRCKIRTMGQKDLKFQLNIREEKGKGMA